MFTIRGFNNYDADAVSRETALDVGDDPGRTQQQFGEECDINTIVKRFGLTGQLPNGIAMPMVGDFTEAKDFQESMNLIKQAEAAFMEIPAHIRARFDHDPAKVMEFMEDKSNYDEAVKLGFIEKPVEKDREGVDIVKP
ncbi:MAG: internal scaffolding protein [Arizlama microvirus]|nr:MAG: internal scaffolding protein [Arizlama microvirus]